MDINQFLNITDDEKPLEHQVIDGGFCGIFRRVCCIGDSLSSGEFQSFDENGKVGYHDFFDYSWGQYLGRIAGIETVYNFSRGGLTAKEYCNSFADRNGLWDVKKACQCYIIALGVNDLFYSDIEIGSIKDIDLDDCNNNKDTFAGYFGKIIQKYKDIEPKAKFFLITMPKDRELREKDKRQHRKLMYDFAELFDNVYVIDLHEYGPKYDENFRKIYYLDGHMSPTGYMLTAKMIASYMDYIIRHNTEEFRQVGFIGTPYYNTKYKL